MKKKKIGVFMGVITSNFSSRVSRAISERAKENGYEVYYFTTFNSYGDNYLYGEGESQIFTLPDYDSFDGIIIAPDTLMLADNAESPVDRLRKVSCPVVSLRAKTEGVYNVLVDESNSMERMIRHFLDTHQFRDVCYMTGRMEMEDAVQRFECYKRVMADYGIPVTDKMVFYGDYWKNKGKEAVDHFLEARGGNYPEAIVCANDYMAIAVCMELENRGIRVPEDICVSGYDDLEEAQRWSPSMTSISVPFEDMARRAVDLIEEIRSGEQPELTQYVPIVDRYRGSCGCKRHKVKNEWHLLTRALEERKEITMQSIFMNADMEGMTEEKTLFNIAHKYNHQNRAYKTWICLCDEEEELSEEERSRGNIRIGYTDRMYLRSVSSRDGGLLLMKECFERHELLPAAQLEEISCGSYYFIPLHYKNNNLGYVVVGFDNCEHYNDSMQPWMMNLAVAMQNYNLHRHLDAMQKIKSLYREDTLTGIMNRRGFEEAARKIYGDASYLGKRVAIVSIDMDNLKKINDAFGHSAGDDALRRIALAVKKVFEKENSAYARTGGDEFCAVCRIEEPGEGEMYIKKVREELTKINQAGSSAYVVEISCGVYEVKDATKVSFMQALELSDERMYEDKRRRKAFRTE